MQGRWEIQEAEDNLGKVVEDAIEKGPQFLTRQGLEVAVVLSFADYAGLKKKQPLSELFRQSPFAGPASE